MRQVVQIAEAADANFVTHATWVQGRAPGMTVVARDDLVLSDCGLPCDTFNYACRARLDDAGAGDRVREAIDFFARRGHPFSWWVGPADRPAGLGELLLAAGLERAESELAMAADLGRLRADGAAPPGLTIERVRTRQALAEFARLSAANWDPPDAHVLRFYEQAAPFVLREDCPLRFYLGRLDGEAVATAEGTIAGGVVGLYNIATLAAHRRRGYGSALTLAPLLKARRDGLSTAVLQAAPDGVSVYRRIGFEPFGEITEYKPRR